MKYFLFFFLIFTIGHAQTGKITYSSILNFGGSGAKQTTSALYFTANASLYQSQLKYDKKTEKEETTKSDSEDSKSVKININVGTDSIGDLYYHNLKNKSIICRGAIFTNPGLKYSIYKDSTNINWQLLDEFKEISGYRCQKAATTFRGRKYEAWFSSEIPLSVGPWKFSGLPGLILEIYDQTGEVYFSAEKIEIPFPLATKKVQIPSGNPTIDFQEFVEEENKASARMTQAMIARLPKGSKLESIKTKRNGIELEYPWSKE